MQAALLGGRRANTKIPVVLAYNEVHYEGLVPDTEEDLLKTIAWKEHYLSNKYTLVKKDIPVFSSLMELNEVKHSDQKLSYAQVLRATGSDSTIRNKTQLKFETQKRRSSMRIADQKQKVASPVHIKRKSNSPQVNDQSKKAVRGNQGRSTRVRKTVEKETKSIEILHENEYTKDSFVSLELLTRLEELKRIKASK